MKTRKTSPRKASVAQKPVASIPMPANPVTPFFRWWDWASLGVAFCVMMVIYCRTLAPEVTLEDSGELVTGSYYAGIPHPPGYPVWTIYSWLWTRLVPFGSIAWRVSLAEAFSGAMACGLVALIVSAGSRLLVQALPLLKALTLPRERTISMMSGLVAGLMMGLDGFMWKESVAANRIAVSSVPWLMVVLLLMLRWLYAPQQHKFIYWALFIFGVCFTTHQSLIVCALGIQVLIAAVKPALGRDIFLGNGAIYLIYNAVLLKTGEHLFHNIGARPGLLLIFHVVGVASLLVGAWLAIRTRAILSEWRVVLCLGLLWLIGAAFYFYMPLTGMTNPPMQWSYPRTVGGFIQALTRGQYEQPNPINVFSDSARFVGQLGMLASGVAESYTWAGVLLAAVPWLFIIKMQRRGRNWLIGLGALYSCLGVLLMILLNPTPDKSSADLVKVFFNSSHTLIAILIGYGIALAMASMVTQYERFRRWGMLAGGVGVVLACFALISATGRHYFGPDGAISVFELPHWIAQAFRPSQYGLPIYAHLLLVAIMIGLLATFVLSRRLPPLKPIVVLLALLPLYSGLAHWFECDQRGHMFGYWYGHDMFKPPFAKPDGKPLYPEMTKNAILFGGTDPGRFCPTYMIFCESFVPYKFQPAEDRQFDRRDVYIITQNALADVSYLNYIRAEYFRSNQVDPPFFSELARMALKDGDYQTNLLARMLHPLDAVCAAAGKGIEDRRRTASSWFSAKDFTNLASLSARLAPQSNQDDLSKFLYEHLSARTQELVSARRSGPALVENLVDDLNRILASESRTEEAISRLSEEKASLEAKIAGGDNLIASIRQEDALEKRAAGIRSEPLYEPQRFRDVHLSNYVSDFLRRNPQGAARIRLNRLLLEEAYPLEVAQSKGGLYPDKEIYTPTIDDMQRCFDVYSQDAARRYQLNQLKPGEEIKVVGNRIQVSGQVAIMAINGLVAKTIFDNNPQNEFFVEESAPIDWMYPHLSPYGIIMKLERQPLATLSDETLDADHQFWKRYSTRLTGDVLDYDTTIEWMTKWIEKTYLRRDLRAFTGDRKFVHDIDAQKSFCKLRTAIAGIYAWRLSAQCPPQYRPKTETEYKRLFREAEFAYRQAFLFCPYNPETLFRYTNLLLQLNRVDEALLLARTYLKLDPYNSQVVSFAGNLANWKKQMISSGTVSPVPRPDLSGHEPAQVVASNTAK
jgi:hypothetical protein